jgi:hypothetical protein
MPIVNITKAHEIVEENIALLSGNTIVHVIVPRK